MRSYRICCIERKLKILQNPSFVLRAVRDVAFEDRPVPTLRGPKDVRVHIAQTGICGSDVSRAFQEFIHSYLLRDRFTTGRKDALETSYSKARLC